MSIMIQKIKEFIIKNLCYKYTIPYYMIMLLLSRRLHNFLHSKIDINNMDYVKKIKEFLRKNANSDIYICLKWAAWDIALYYLYLSEVFEILLKNDNKIVILCNKKFIDIFSLYKRFFPKLKCLGVDDYVFLETETETEIRKILKLDDSYVFLDLRDSYDYCISSFKNWTGIYEYNKSLGSFIKNGNLSKENTKHINSYVYTNIDKEKLDNLENNFSNEWKMIVCNFENKSYKLAWKDSIKFSDYLEEMLKIVKRNNIKIVINSVYNNENLYNDSNISVTRLNFQEIIWLAEHGKIKLFISERNWLNDVFRVFYPNINQIIYYPNYYNPCVDKKIYYKIYKERLKHFDVKDFWHLPWNNIIEDIRWNFFNTIEKYLDQLF